MTKEDMAKSNVVPGVEVPKRVLFERLYTLYDKKADTYINPFIQPSDSAAIRSISSEVNNPNGNSDLARFPADMSLYCIGNFDRFSGRIYSFNPIQHIIDAGSLLELPLDVPARVASYPGGS